jgi:hypothetical protein
MRRGLAGRLRQDEEPLLRYVLDARPVHEQLQRALMLLSGFALMRLTSQPRSTIDDGPVQTARELLTGVHDRLSSLRVPEAAAHHHHHLRGAGSALRLALAITSSAIDSGDQLYRALAQTVMHLRATNRILPGFETVDLAQSCCAAHGQLAASAPLRS